LSFGFVYWKGGARREILVFFHGHCDFLSSIFRLSFCTKIWSKVNLKGNK
jgi:hypothetical protein